MSKPMWSDWQRQLLAMVVSPADVQRLQLTLSGKAAAASDSTGLAKAESLWEATQSNQETNFPKAAAAFLSSLPQLQLNLAYLPTYTQLAELTTLLRELLDEPIVLEPRYEPTIAGGYVFSHHHQRYDGSLKQDLSHYVHAQT